MLGNGKNCREIASSQGLGIGKKPLFFNLLKRREVEFKCSAGTLRESTENQGSKGIRQWLKSVVHPQ